MAKAWVCVYCSSINSEPDKKCAKCGKQRPAASSIQLLSTEDKKVLHDLQEEIQKVKAESTANKWEYLQISSDQIESYGGLQKLGRQGWELVAATSYSEGGGVTFLGSGSESYTIKLMYIFKRPTLPRTNEIQTKLREIVNHTPKHLLEYLRELEGF